MRRRYVVGVEDASQSVAGRAEVDRLGGQVSRVIVGVDGARKYAEQHGLAFLDASRLSVTGRPPAPTRPAEPVRPPRPPAKLSKPTDPVQAVPAQSADRPDPFGPDGRSRGGRKTAEKRRREALEASQTVTNLSQSLRSGGVTLREIAARLNADGRRTRQGALWSAETVRRLLIRAGRPFQAATAD